MIGLEKYLPSERDTWTWSLAQFGDITDIVTMAVFHFQHEIEEIFTPDYLLLTKHLGNAVIEQTYNRQSQQLLVARNRLDNKLMAWAWIGRGTYTTYAKEEIAEAKFAHMDLRLPVRVRLTMMAQILHQWYAWCMISQIPVMVSTSIRTDQAGFMRLHESAGFSVRGSIGYLKVTS